MKVTGIDELPQLFNVLFGHMSIVGPRPHIRSELEEFGVKDDDPLLSVRPRLTGPWQVATIGKDKPTPMEDRINIGRQYAEQDWKLSRDLGYIWQTIRRGFWRGHDGEKLDP